jgi:glycosyltransferase involved in cell wall biosynthesis
VGYIHAADMCLGIFGESGKAGRVIPNKAYQVLSCGKPLITRDSEAIRELFPFQVPGILLIPPGDPDLLAQAVLDMAGALSSLPANLHESIQEPIRPQIVARQLLDLVASRKVCRTGV